MAVQGRAELQEGRVPSLRSPIPAPQDCSCAQRVETTTQRLATSLVRRNQTIS